MKKKATAEALPKSVKELTDTQHAIAIHAFLTCDGDINKTFVSLKRKIGKRTLLYYAERYRWDLRHEELQNSLIADAVEDAKAKKRLDLDFLREVKGRLMKQITDKRTFVTKDGKVLQIMLNCNNLGEAATALINVMREERDIIGDGGGKPDTQTIFMFVRERVLEISNNGGEQKSDNGRKAKSRFDTTTGELVDDNPFNLQR